MVSTNSSRLKDWMAPPSGGVDGSSIASLNSHDLGTCQHRHAVDVSPGTPISSTMGQSEWRKRPLPPSCPRQYNFPAACPEKDYYGGRKRLTKADASGIQTSGDVYQRLTDHRFYTGSHRNRFDEFGNGRGRAGREDLVVDTGWSPCQSRETLVYATIQQKPSRPVVEPGTLGVQKYGVQAISCKVIWVYRNGDIHHDGTAFFIKHYVKDLHRLYRELSPVINAYGGPIRKLYDQNFEIVRHMAELVDGAKYLATAGEPPAPLAKLRNFCSCFVPGV